MARAAFEKDANATPETSKAFFRAQAKEYVIKILGSPDDESEACLLRAEHIYT